MAKIALEAWAEHGLFAVLHGHLHQPAIYDLNQMFGLGMDHPYMMYMRGLLRQIVYIKMNR